MVLLYYKLNGMRTFLLSAILISCIAAKAQNALPVNLMDYIQRGKFGGNIYFTESMPDKKWSLSTYTGISTSFNFFNGSHATVVAAPLGLRLNRRLNNNLYAFAGISVTPAYINFNHSFLSADMHTFYPGNGFYKPGSVGMYPGAEMGLMYVNDSRTFSISGSISVQRSSYPVFPYPPMGNARQNPVITPKK
jgi:hypothetical protein